MLSFATRVEAERFARNLAVENGDKLLDFAVVGNRHHLPVLLNGSLVLECNERCFVLLRHGFRTYVVAYDERGAKGWQFIIAAKVYEPNADPFIERINRALARIKTLRTEVDVAVVNAYRHGHSVFSISRLTGLHRKTVAKRVNKKRPS